MQKVSKQSLAMLALSILLAISIALTFTFAALADDQKTATGTITFDGTVAIELGAGFTEAGGNAYTFELTANEAGVELADTLTIGLASSSVNSYVKVTVSALSGNNAVALTLANADSVSALYDADGNVFESKAKIVAGSNVKLADLIKITTDMTKIVDDSSVTFTVTVDASATNGGNWA